MMESDSMKAAYHFLETEDEHLGRLFHWIKTLEKLAHEVRESQMDNELYDELEKINNRLIREVGFRTVAVFTWGEDENANDPRNSSLG